MTYAIYDDQELNRFSFDRTEIEAQQRFALIAPHHRLTLHGWVSTSTPKDDNVVPFYLERTLGGTSYVRGVHEDRIGSDGTQATLRGFRNLRFRDRNLLLLQAEYRIPLWSSFDATVFADAGKVTPRREDLDLSDLEHDFGFSLSAMKGGATAVRVDVGMGGGEGVRVFLTLGDVIR
jgi:outer membrane protein assembly factor BamA